MPGEHHEKQEDAVLDAPLWQRMLMLAYLHCLERRLAKWEQQIARFFYVKIADGFIAAKDIAAEDIFADDESLKPEVQLISKPHVKKLSLGFDLDEVLSTSNKRGFRARFIPLVLTSSVVDTQPYISPAALSGIHVDSDFLYCESSYESSFNIDNPLYRYENTKNESVPAIIESRLFRENGFASPELTATAIEKTKNELRYSIVQTKLENLSDLLDKLLGEHDRLLQQQSNLDKKASPWWSTGVGTVSGCGLLAISALNFWNPLGWVGFAAAGLAAVAGGYNTWRMRRNQHKERTETTTKLTALQEDRKINELLKYRDKIKGILQNELCGDIEKLESIVQTYETGISLLNSIEADDSLIQQPESLSDKAASMLANMKRAQPVILTLSKVPPEIGGYDVSRWDSSPDSTKNRIKAESARDQQALRLRSKEESRINNASGAIGPRNLQKLAMPAVSPKYKDDVDDELLKPPTPPPSKLGPEAENVLEEAARQAEDLAAKAKAQADRLGQFAVRSELNGGWYLQDQPDGKDFSDDRRFSEPVDQRAVLGF